MGGRGGSPNSGQPAPAEAAPATAVASEPERLKPRDLKPGMWIFKSPENEWRQIGSIKNRGRAGRNTFGQYEIRGSDNRLITRLSPNGTALVDRSREA